MQENPDNKDHPYFLEVQVVGKIPDGVERNVTSLADILDLRGIAVSGNLIDIDKALYRKMQKRVSVSETLKRIFAVFMHERSLKE